MSVNNTVTGKPASGENNDYYIVGIGASAGGLEALQKLLTSLPPDTGFPFVIVQHLSPDYKSLLGEILGKYTEMPVIQVEDGMEVQPNCVYVIQPGKNMRISKGKLLLSAQREKELNLPIDMFFRSLAEEAGPQAIAIVLSGTGSDGTNGIKDIKEHDGMVIVQDLESSKFDGMPRSAMRTGLVDAQISPEDIARELQHISQAASKQPYTLLRSERQIDADLMKRVYVILKKVSNINFTHYKQTTILRRLERRMMLAHKDTLAEYVEYLGENAEEVKTLSREVLIGVTNFFRDPEYFQCLKDKAIQNIVLHSDADDAIRVWVAGCSTGEEAYSIAILFCEVMESLKIKRSVKIFATDLDVDSITTAGKGVYGDNIIDAVSPARLSRYFTRKNNTYVISRDVRKMIVFSPHNVFQDPPFGRLDLISCRNMLIYFQSVLQNDLFSLFHSALKDGGYLFLGKSEAIGAFTDAFPVVDAAAKLFTHRSDVRIPNQKRVPYLQTTFLEDEMGDDREDRHMARRSTVMEISTVEQEAIDTSLLERFMPACLVVNEKNDIVHLYGESGNYVHLPIGRFTNNVFDLITEGLKVPASTILKEARERKTLVQYKDISFRGEREEAVITLTAMPIAKTAQENESLFAMVFAEKAQRGEMPEAVTYDIDRVASQRITDLEQDLSEVQGKLDKSMAEQECVNEELQAANEELLTANEELQSSNEELQSVNEELYTVNSEYQQKLTELADLNDDIANFLSSTLTGIIFVDNKLNIRRYTDYVTTEFSVMDHDIGRSLKFISYHFPTVDITEICENVLKTLIPDEREISTSKSKVFFMRVAPYRSTENKILGCVITLVDITTQKQGQVQLASTEKKLNAAKETIEAKSDYLSRVAHEIRTPMSVLQGLAKIAKQQLGDSAAITTSLEKINETVGYMASIVTDIAEASRIELSSAELISEPFSLRAVLDRLETEFRDRLASTGTSFEVVLQNDFAPAYLGDEAVLQQMLAAFLQNAIQYTPAGGLITLKAYEDIARTNTDDKVPLCFVISDTGVGIRKEFLPEIFKPFTRDVKQNDNSDTGMGLGLPIAKNLIESMGGDVSVESEVGKGTTFTIHVNLYHAPSADSAVHKIAAEKKQIDLIGSRVLVAEDNELNRIVLCNMLKKEGMTYTEVIDGEQAVNVFTGSPEHTFDFILMDMRMPKLDGIRATERIRASGRADAKTVPIIGVSANGFAEDIRKAREAGINEYTIKPIDRDRLITLMRRLKP